MMCERPYIKTPTGVKAAHTIGRENRLATTPFPCGSCLHCRINQARVLKNRILLEQSTSEDSCWSTLTYEDENLPVDKYNKAILVPSHLTKFIKRIRRKIEPVKIRYLAVGEYGEESWRPHFHICLFNISSREKKLIEDTWKKGFTFTTELNNEIAAYTVGYLTEKLNKDEDVKKLGLPPEYMVSSKGNEIIKGGMGIEAIERMARKIKKSPYVDKDIIRQITWGKKKAPLGRYLTLKLAELIGVDDQDLENEFWLSQEKNYEDNLEGDGIYYDRINKEKEAERKAQRKRYELFKRRKKI